jgi:hypothetical protein
VDYNERPDIFSLVTELALALRKLASPKFNKSAVRALHNPEMIKEYLRDKRYLNQAARRGHLWPANSPPTFGISSA